MSSLPDIYDGAARRLLLLDYDGTLREFEPTPELATPTPEIKTLLGRLAADPKNTVVIISGRDHATLDDWLGDLPLHFVAEHGMAYRAPSQPWQFAAKPATDWQASVRRLMDDAVAIAPGSLIETKPSSLVWHYRKAGHSTAVQAREQLLDDLSPILEKHNLRALSGNKVVEVQPKGTDKGASARRWFDLDAYDFVLAMGDDVTDEDLFAAMPPRAVTIKIGDSDTKAQDRLPAPADARQLLARLAQEKPEK